ncbi:unnamed protein product [Lactuca saligna]|uniref:Uncharacterized protein n=1 Tax=Lactuca saligna TaxID=75948 RepID=A0AA35V099_LACSI|nr:unnamed protein product [Lactuca saligna]
MNHHRRTTCISPKGSFINRKVINSGASASNYFKVLNKSVRRTWSHQHQWNVLPPINKLLEWVNFNILTNLENHLCPALSDAGQVNPTALVNLCQFDDHVFASLFSGPIIFRFVYMVAATRIPHTHRLHLYLSRNTYSSTLSLLFLLHPSPLPPPILFFHFRLYFHCVPLIPPSSL